MNDRPVISPPLVETLLVYGLFIVVAIPVGLVILKKILWWLFSFDTRIANLLSQKKSSEVLTGKIIEELAPLLPNFPVNYSKEGSSLCFLGKPIDYIYFDDEGITFIEIKSANAKLSGKQRLIKEHIQNGKVRFLTYRRS